MNTAENQMTTEMRNPRTMQLDTLSALEILEIMNREDASVPRAIHGHLEEIARVPSFRNGLTKSVRCDIILISHRYTCVTAAL